MYYLLIYVFTYIFLYNLFIGIQSVTCCVNCGVINKLMWSVANFNPEFDTD